MSSVRASTRLARVAAGHALRSAQQELTLASETNDEISARSSEGLEITIDVTVLYQVVRDSAAALHQDIGRLTKTSAAAPRCARIRDGISEYRAAGPHQHAARRAAKRIEDSLITALGEDNISVLSVLLRDVRIPESITQAIEEKQAAEQQVAVEENRRRQAEIAAQRAVVEATGARARRHRARRGRGAGAEFARRGHPRKP